MQEIFVYYESIKRELKTEPIYDCRCDERLKCRVEEQAGKFFLEKKSFLGQGTRLQGSSRIDVEQI